MGRNTLVEDSCKHYEEVLERLSLYTCNHSGWIEQTLEIRWGILCEMHELINTALPQNTAQTNTLVERTCKLCREDGLFHLGACRYD
jgi:hypothetical protein